MTWVPRSQGISKNDIDQVSSEYFIHHYEWVKIINNQLIVQLINATPVRNIFSSHDKLQQMVIQRKTST